MILKGLRFLIITDDLKYTATSFFALNTSSSFLVIFIPEFCFNFDKPCAGVSYIVQTVLHEVLEACFAAAGNKRFDFLRTGTGGDHEGIRNVHNDKIVHTQTSDQTARSGNNNATRGLLGNDCKQ